LSLYALPSQSLLSLSTHAGLSALRLPCCHVPHEVATPSATGAKRQSINEILNEEPSEDGTVSTQDPAAEVPAPAGNQRNVDCPTCNSHLGTLASQVAMSHHVNSTIVCRISGEVLDSQNEPMAFPNGYVYGSKVSSCPVHAHSACSLPERLLMSDRHCERWQRPTLTSSLVREQRRLAHLQDSVKFTFRNRELNSHHFTFTLYYTYILTCTVATLVLQLARSC
jgi:hypothetical protein